MPDPLPDTILYFIRAGDRQGGTQTWAALRLHSSSAKGLAQGHTVDEAHCAPWNPKVKVRNASKPDTDGLDGKQPDIHEDLTSSFHEEKINKKGKPVVVDVAIQVNIQKKINK